MDDPLIQQLEDLCEDTKISPLNIYFTIKGVRPGAIFERDKNLNGGYDVSDKKLRQLFRILNKYGVQYEINDNWIYASRNPIPEFNDDIDIGKFLGLPEVFDLSRKDSPCQIGYVVEIAQPIQFNDIMTFCVSKLDEQTMAKCMAILDKMRKCLKDNTTYHPLEFPVLKIHRAKSD